MHLINNNFKKFTNKILHSKYLKYNIFLYKYFKKDNLIYKYRSNIQDKLFYYYNIKSNLSLFTHKTFILFEMQLSTLLIKTKIIPYLHIASDLCYYRLVFVNTTAISNSHYIVGLYDIIQIPYFLHQQFYYKQFQLFLMPKYLRKFFKYYWKVLADYSTNKVWIINNYIASSFTAQAILFEYPNINLYQAPFRRFTKLYHEAHPFNANAKLKYTANTLHIVKLKLFEYAQFYR
jgi:hypothetical protein